MHSKLRLALLRLAIALLCAYGAFAQSEPKNASVAKSSCVIMASAEPAKGIATWSMEGRRQKHTLTYLAGEYPPGIPFRSSINDKDVDKIRAKGGRVVILDPHYTREDLEKAKQSCENPPEKVAPK